MYNIHASKLVIQTFIQIQLDMDNVTHFRRPDSQHKEAA
jgi:hypothetical protein